MLKIWRLATLVLASTWLLWACATPGVADSPEATLAPNANLVAQGIPAIPMSLVRKVERYTEFRGHAFVDWHPTRSEMLVSHRGAGSSVTQIYRLTKPLAQPEALTEGADAVRSASYEPRDGRYIVFTRSSGGDEANQLYRLDLPGRQATLLTNPQEAHSVVGWVRGTSQLLYTSVPLDRTAQGGTRAVINTTLSLIDPLNPQAGRRVLATLPGPGWFGGGVSEDGRFAALVNYRSAADSHIWLVDLSNGERRQLLPAAGEQIKAAHFSAGFSADGKQLYVVSDRASEFRELMALDLASGALQRISAHIPWDVSGGAVSLDSRWLATQVNNDGREEIHLFDARSLQALPPPTAPAGRIGTMAFHRTQHLLAYSLDSARGPSQLHVFDPATGRSQAWTQTSAPSGIDPAQFAEQTVVRWKSFDGRAISGLLSTPPARFSGKRPVIINIHGGPEAQAQMGFNGRAGITSCKNWALP